MRLELSEGTSHKFWEATRRGKVLHIRWGRIGTDGQAQDKSFASDDVAQKELDKLVASKRKKGYVDAKGGKPAKSAPVAKRAATEPAPSKPGKAAPAPTTTASTLRRVDRSIDLMELSGAGQIGPQLPEALEYPDRACFVQYAKNDKRLLKLRHLRKLELDGEIPSWIGELKGLRTLVCWASKIPPSLLTLPHLRFLHIDSSPGLESLAGLEKMAALETVTCGDTPLAEEDGALEAYAKSVPGAKLTRFITGLDFKRTRPPAPKDKAKLVAAINADTLADGSDLRGRDLAGARFEHAYISHDLRKAKLANTTWSSCDFEWAQLEGADLTGATFHDCYFSGSFGGKGMFEAVKAAGATFVGCGGTLILNRADLRGAKLLDMESDLGLYMNGANARELTVQLSFISEREHRMEAKGASLQGADLQLDITPARRAELSKKKTARLAWKTDHFKGARTDKTTRITYATLDAKSDGPATRAAEQTVDPKGKAATILGTMYASNASLWLVVADADVAAQWRGAVDESDPKDDFQRALKTQNKKIAIGSGEGVCVHVGFNAWSHIYSSASAYSGVRLLDAAISEEDKPVRDRGLALRMGQWPIWTMPKTIGKFVCPTGVVTLMLPYRDGAFPPKLRAKATNGAVVVDPEYDRALVHMKVNGPGIYEVATYGFRPEKGRGEYEDELGTYGNVIEISYVDRLPAKYRSAT